MSLKTSQISGKLLVFEEEVGSILQKSFSRSLPRPCGIYHHGVSCCKTLANPHNPMGIFLEMLTSDLLNLSFGECSPRIGILERLPSNSDVAQLSYWFGISAVQAVRGGKAGSLSEEGLGSHRLPGFTDALSDHEGTCGAGGMSLPLVRS